MKLKTILKAAALSLALYLPAAAQTPLLLNHSMCGDPEGKLVPHDYRRVIVDPVLGTREFLMVWQQEFLDPDGSANAERIVTSLRQRVQDWPGLHAQHNGKYVVCFNLEGEDWDLRDQGEPWKMNYAAMARKINFMRDLKKLAGDEFLFGFWGDPPWFCPANWTGGNPGDPLLGRRIIEKLNREMTPLGREVDICFPGVYFSKPESDLSASLTAEEARNYVEYLILVTRGLYGGDKLCLPFLWPEGYEEWQAAGEDDVDTPQEQEQRRHSGELFGALCEMACTTGDGFVLWVGQPVKPSVAPPPWDWNADWVQNGLLPVCRRHARADSQASFPSLAVPLGQMIADK